MSGEWAVLSFHSLVVIAARVIEDQGWCLDFITINVSEVQCRFVMICSVCQ